MTLWTAKSIFYSANNFVRDNKLRSDIYPYDNNLILFIFNYTYVHVYVYVRVAYFYTISRILIIDSSILLSVAISSPDQVEDSLLVRGYG